MKQPLAARIALGKAQINRLESEYQALLSDPAVSTQCQILLGWLESILDVGVSQELWNRSFQRAVAELESLRQRGTWSPGFQPDSSGYSASH